jgi:hypothetical protein
MNKDKFHSPTNVSPSLFLAAVESPRTAVSFEKSGKLFNVVLRIHPQFRQLHLRMPNGSILIIEKPD